LEAVLALLGSLPKNPPAAIFVVIHAGPEATDFCSSVDGANDAGGKHRATQTIAQRGALAILRGLAAA
jgi:hypothetical protein